MMTPLTWGWGWGGYSHSRAIRVCAAGRGSQSKIGSQDLKLKSGIQSLKVWNGINVAHRDIKYYFIEMKDKRRTSRLFKKLLPTTEAI